MYKCFVVFAVFWIVCYVTAAERVRRAFCSTRDLDIPNGDYKLGAGNAFADYTCDREFQLYGYDRVVCIDTDKWSSTPPACVANTCRHIPPDPKLRVTSELDGAVLKFSCGPLYKLDGPSTLLCNGTAWSDRVPVCNPWKPPLSCSFESQDLCGWYNEGTGDDVWYWNTGKTKTPDTGPSHDHTLGSGEKGHYMYFESSSTKRNDEAVFTSPLFPPGYIDRKCFNFWYHIHGSDDIGQLKLFYRQEGRKLEDLEPVFVLNEARGDQWYLETIPISHQISTFQIVFVASRDLSGKFYRSDFAIDDIAIVDCPRNLTRSTAPSVTAARVTASTTRPTTAVNVSTKQYTNNFENVSSTRVTQTTAIIHTTVTSRLNTKQPTSFHGQSVLTTNQTDSEPKTLAHSTDKFSRHSMGSSTTLKPVVNPHLHENESLKPIINPHLHGQDFDRQTSDSVDHTSKLIYIFIGLGIAVVVVAIVSVGICLYKKQIKGKYLIWSRFSSANPLYSVMVDGEDTLTFVSGEHIPDDDERTHI